MVCIQRARAENVSVLNNIEHVSEILSEQAQQAARKNFFTFFPLFEIDIYILFESNLLDPSVVT